MAKLHPIVLLFFFASAAAEDTTSNLVDNDNWSIDGDVYTCKDCKWNGAGQSMDQNADIIWVYSDEQGTVSQTFDLTPYNDIGQIDYKGDASTFYFDKMTMHGNALHHRRGESKSLFVLTLVITWPATQNKA